MGWLGKVFGGTFGLMLGGPLGALLGAAIGHQLDRGLEGFESFPRLEPGRHQRIQMAFFTATFSVMGHLAKADGRVTEEEIAIARRIMERMDLSPDMREAAIRLFREGKSPGFPLDETLDQFRREIGRRASLVRLFLEILLQAAYADGSLHPKEERLLLHICNRLGFSRFEFQALRAFMEAQLRFSQAQYQYRQQRRNRYRGAPGRHQPSVNDAYAVLGVTPAASDGEIKKAYRRLMSQHHPDKLVAKGLPEEMVKIATEKTQKIREAYEIIQRHRKR